MSKTGIDLIIEERQRQVHAEGYDAAHDDEHKEREIARAAFSYVEHYVRRAWVFTNEYDMPGVVNGPQAYRKKADMPDDWPWLKKHWNPQNPMRDLVKAGALIAAEIDRLQRLK